MLLCSLFSILFFFFPSFPIKNAKIRASKIERFRSALAFLTWLVTLEGVQGWEAQEDSPTPQPSTQRASHLQQQVPTPQSRWRFPGQPASGVQSSPPWSNLPGPRDTDIRAPRRPRQPAWLTPDAAWLPCPTRPPS